LKKFCDLVTAHRDSPHMRCDGMNCLHDSHGSCCARLVVDFMHGALLGGRKTCGDEATKMPNHADDRKATTDCAPMIGNPVNTACVTGSSLIDALTAGG
jgi:hypothetical protein